MNSKHTLDYLTRHHYYTNNYLDIYVDLVTNKFYYFDMSSKEVNDAGIGYSLDMFWYLKKLPITYEHLLVQLKRNKKLESLL